MTEEEDEADDIDHSHFGAGQHWPISRRSDQPIRVSFQLSDSFQRRMNALSMGEIPAKCFLLRYHPSDVQTDWRLKS